MVKLDYYLNVLSMINDQKKAENQRMYNSFINGLDLEIQKLNATPRKSCNDQPFCHIKDSKAFLLSVLSEGLGFAQSAQQSLAVI